MPWHSQCARANYLADKEKTALQDEIYEGGNTQRNNDRHAGRLMKRMEERDTSEFGNMTLAAERRRLRSILTDEAFRSKGENGVWGKIYRKISLKRCPSV